MLKNEPELLQEFNILTAMAFPDLDLTNIQIDKHNKQLENFYSNQSTMQCGKPFPIDHFMVSGFSSFDFVFLLVIFFLKILISIEFIFQNR